MGTGTPQLLTVGARRFVTNGIGSALSHSRGGTAWTRLRRSWKELTPSTWNLPRELLLSITGLMEHVKTWLTCSLCTLLRRSRGSLMPTHSSKLLLEKLTKSFLPSFP